MKAAAAFVALFLAATLSGCGASPPASAEPVATTGASGPAMPQPSPTTGASEPATSQPEPTVTPRDAGTPPPFLGKWTVTGYRVKADGERSLYEGGALKGTTVEFLADGTTVTRSSVRTVTEQWTLAPDGQITIEGEGTSRVVPYKVDSDTLLLGNTDGTFTELASAE